MNVGRRAGPEEAVCRETELEELTSSGRRGWSREHARCGRNSVRADARKLFIINHFH